MQAAQSSKLNGLELAFCGLFGVGCTMFVCSLVLLFFMP